MFITAQVAPAPLAALKTPIVKCSGYFENAFSDKTSFFTGFTFFVKCVNLLTNLYKLID